MNGTTRRVRIRDGRSRDTTAGTTSRARSRSAGSARSGGNRPVPRKSAISVRNVTRPYPVTRPRPSATRLPSSKQSAVLTSTQECAKRCADLFLNPWNGALLPCACECRDQTGGLANITKAIPFRRKFETVITVPAGVNVIYFPLNDPLSTGCVVQVNYPSIGLWTPTVVATTAGVGTDTYPKGSLSRIVTGEIKIANYTPEQSRGAVAYFYPLVGSGNRNASGDDTFFNEPSPWAPSILANLIDAPTKFSMGDARERALRVGTMTTWHRPRVEANVHSPWLSASAVGGAAPFNPNSSGTLWDIDSNAYAEGCVLVLMNTTAQTISITACAVVEYYHDTHDQFSQPVPVIDEVLDGMRAINTALVLPQSKLATPNNSWFQPGTKSYSVLRSIFSGAKTVMDYATWGIEKATPLLELAMLSL